MGSAERARRAGFTLFEVAVAAVILAMMAAVVMPQIMEALHKKRVDDTYDLLLELRDGLTNSRKMGFMNVVRTGASTTNSMTIPGRLSHLAEAVVANDATNYPNSCGGPYNATVVTTWNENGPFLSRVVSTATGLRAPIGQVQNTLIRTPATTNTNEANFIVIRINGVDPRDAAALDRLVDGSDSPTSGSIQYSATGGVATVDYLIPVFVNRC